MARNLKPLWVLAWLSLGAVLVPAGAQTQHGGWKVEVPAPGAQQPSAPPANTTVVPRSPGVPKGGAPGQLSFAAFLTEESQPIQQGLVWRVFREKATGDGKNVLVSTHRDASPTLRLEPGTYQVNVALGRANLTRKIVVARRSAYRRSASCSTPAGLRVDPGARQRRSGQRQGGQLRGAVRRARPARAAHQGRDRRRRPAWCCGSTPASTASSASTATPTRWRAPT